MCCPSPFHLLSIVLWGRWALVPKASAVRLHSDLLPSSRWTLPQGAWQTHCPVYTFFVFLPPAFVFLPAKVPFTHPYECNYNSFFKTQPSPHFSMQVFLTAAVYSSQEYWLPTQLDALEAQSIIYAY